MGKLREKISKLKMPKIKIPRGKSLEELPELQQEIIITLGGNLKKSRSLEGIHGILRKEYSDPEDPRETRKALRELMKYGIVRGKETEGGTRYFLSSYIGSGSRLQASALDKPNPVRDAYRFIKRLVGSIFLLFGFILLYQNLTISGAVISGVIENKNTHLIFSLALIFIGAFLLFLSFKKRTKKKRKS